MRRQNGRVVHDRAVLGEVDDLPQKRDNMCVRERGIERRCVYDERTENERKKQTAKGVRVHREW